MVDKRRFFDVINNMVFYEQPFFNDSMQIILLCLLLGYGRDLPA